MQLNALTGLACRCTVAARPDEREVSMNGDGALSGFLTKLHEDSELQEAYTNDPEGTLRQAGVSDDTIEAILSRDLGRIKGVLEKELPGGDYIMFMVILKPKL
jgi:hypothetical protein